jgi:hypothetical protein
VAPRSARIRIGANYHQWSHDLHDIGRNGRRLAAVLQGAIPAAGM